MRAIGDGGFATPPEKGEFKAGVFRNHIAQRGLKCRGGDMLLVNPSQHLTANGPMAMTRRLGGAELTGIAEDGEDVAGHRIGEVRIRARRRSKMPGIVHLMLDILENVEQVSLRHPVLAHGFDRVQVFGNGSGLETFEMRGTLVINRQRGVLRVGCIHALSRLPQAFA